MVSWNEGHSANLKKCIDIVPLIAKLTEQRPDLKGDSIEKRAISSSEREGYEKCINDIVMLSELQEPPIQKTNFVEGLEEFEQRPPPIET